MPSSQSNHEEEHLHRQRWELLEHFDALTEKPLIFLSFVWLILLIVDFTRGLGGWLSTLTYAIWAVFVVDFLVEITIAPDRKAYLKRNLLTLISLLLPALGILRVFRAFRALRAARALRATTATRSISLVRLVTSINRGMRATRATLARRGLGYAIAITTIVLFAGAAGMYVFESPSTLAREGDVVGASQARGFSSYGDALWWTAMAMTTIGSEFWPRTSAGRLLAWLISVYALGVFSYITASIATYFIGRERRG